SILGRPAFPRAPPRRELRLCTLPRSGGARLSPSPRAPQRRGAMPTVLVIDDDPAVRRLVRMVLGPAGIQLGAFWPWAVPGGAPPHPAHAPARRAAPPRHTPFTPPRGLAPPGGGAPADPPLVHGRAELAPPVAHDVARVPGQVEGQVVARDVERRPV